MKQSDPQKQPYHQIIFWQIKWQAMLTKMGCGCILEMTKTCIITTSPLLTIHPFQWPPILAY